ncbi:MAG: lactonase family protein [Kouleothrix sp.]|nr:lactonase family protein [Kouleothrix sp.]
MTAELLLVGGYAAADRPGIHALDFDQATGALTPRGSLAGVANPSFLVVHPNRRWFYAVGETSQASGAPGSVWACGLERAPLALRAVNQQPSGGDDPCHLLLDAAGGWLIVSNYSSGSVGVLPILPDGSLGELTDLAQHRGSGPNPARQEGPHAHSATLTPDGRFVIVADLGLDQLLVYALDRAAGKLIPHGQAAARPGAGPRHMAFHPGGRRAYVANELDNTVAMYDYDAASGALRELQALDTLPAGAPESYVADIHIAPSGERLYVSNRGHDSLAVFDVAPDGRLDRAAIRPCGGRWPRNFALAPGGRFALVANQHSDELAALPLPGGPQAVGEPVARAAAAGAACVQVVGAAD